MTNFSMGRHSAFSASWWPWSEKTSPILIFDKDLQRRKPWRNAMVLGWPSAQSNTSRPRKSRDVNRSSWPTSNLSRTRWCPPSAARWRGVWPSASSNRTEAPFWRRSSTTGRWPAPAARCSAVAEPALVRAFTSAPCASRHRTVSLWPAREA